MACYDLIINGSVITPAQGYQLEQTYEVVPEGRIQQRMQSGMLRTFTLFQKLKTTIRGTGQIPPALSGIDWTQDLTIQCVAPRGTAGGIPGASRGGSSVTTYDSNGGTVTTTLYWPILVCRSAGPRDGGNVRDHAYGWEIVAEEV